MSILDTALAPIQTATEAQESAQAAPSTLPASPTIGGNNSLNWQQDMTSNSQFYLMKNLPSFVDHYNSKRKLDHVITFDTETPSQFVTTLLGMQNLKRFLEIQTHEISSLVPKVEFYKVIVDDAGVIKGEIPIPLTTQGIANINDILNSKENRGDDVGLKSVRFNFQNQDMFGHDKLLGLSLELLFQNPYALMAEREQGFKYVDLLLYNNSIDSEEYAGHKYRIKMELGHQIPPSVMPTIDQTLATQIANNKLTLILQMVNYDLDIREDGLLALNVEYLSHVPLETDRDKYDIFGMVKNLKSLEDNLNTHLASLETASETIQNKKSELLDQVENASPENKETVENNIKGELDQVNEGLGDLTQKAKDAYAMNKVIKYSSIIKALSEREKIYSITVPKENMLYYETTALAQNALPGFLGDTFAEVAGEAVLNTPEGQKNIGIPEIQGGPNAGSAAEAIFKDKAASDVDPDNVEAAASSGLAAAGELAAGFDQSKNTAAVDPHTDTIYFFYLADLLDAVIDANSFQSTLKEQKIGYMFGPAQYIIPESDGSTYQFNLGSLPIAVENFSEFFKNKINTQSKSVYKLAEFARDMARNLAQNTLQKRPFGQSVRSRTTIEGNLIAVPGFSDGKPVFEPGSANTNKNFNSGFADFFDLPSLEVPDSNNGAIISDLNSKTVAADQLYHYYTFHAIMDGADQSHDAESNLAKGIPHFYIGADRGLVKSIKFDKARLAGYNEMIAFSGDKAKERELWQVFNVQIEMFGNVIAKPGSYIYVDPTILGFGNPSSENSVSRKLGIGGYYFVTKVNHTIDPNSGWNTSIYGYYQGRGAKTQPPKL